MRSGTRWGSLILALVVLGLLGLSPGNAWARFYNPGDKAGPIMFNLKIGAAIGIDGNGVPIGFPAGGSAGTTLDQFAIQLDAGFAITPDRNAYLLFPLQFQLGGGCSRYYYGIGYACGDYANIVMIPFGFQYDIPIRAVPGLYLYPRFEIGYAAAIYTGGEGTRHLGFVIPEFGGKYVLKRRWNFGFEAFNLPIFFNGGGAWLNYRLLWYAGVNL